MYYSRIVWDSETLQVVSRESTTYAGPADQCKGGNSEAQQAEDDAVSQQQLNLQQMQLQQQQGQLNQVNPTLQAMIANGGLTPQALASYKAQMINSLPQTYDSLYGNLSQQLTARGLTGGQYGAGGGGVAAGYGSLGSAEAGQAQQGVFNIAQLQQQGLNNALNTSLGVASQYGGNVSSLGNQGTQALGSATTAAGNADQATSDFWGSLFGAIASPFKLVGKI